MKNEIIPYEQVCQYCQNLIPFNLIQDHILCHQINEAENKNNKLNNPFIKYNNNDNTISGNNSNNFKNKFFGFFENIGNKAKDIFKKEEKQEKNITQSEESNRQNKLSIFFNNLSDSISQTFDEIKQEIKSTFDKSKTNKTPNDLISNENNNYRDDNNIDDLLLRFEEEDVNIDNNKNNLFKEDDANEILKYLPNSEIKEEKNKNKNNYKCVICLYEFKIGDKVCTLPCLHIFHIDCLRNWIIRDTSCPICKLDLSLDSLFSNNNIEDNN